MRYVLLTLTVFVLLACQVPLLGLLGVHAFTLDLPLIAVMYLAATSRPLGGFVTAVFVGLLADSFAPGAVLGTHMEIMGLLFLANLLLAGRFQWSRPLPLMVLTLVGSIASGLLFYLFSTVFDEGFSGVEASFGDIALRLLVTTLAAPLLFRLFGLIDGRLRGRRVHSPLLR
jgi:rod shape-determining protein MreD